VNSRAFELRLSAFGLPGARRIGGRKTIARTRD
jgi:hypothetical protein